MAKKRRRQFFHLRYPRPLERPVFWDELGAQVKLAGVVVTGRRTGAILWLPGHYTADYPLGFEFIEPTAEDWVTILQATDSPEIFELDETGAVKAVHRKSMRSVGAAIQWGVWRRDGFRCMYCEAEGGINRPLTIDHFVPVELAGTDEMSNLLAACRSCNKKKSSLPPKVFCEAEGLDYEGLVEYLAGRASRIFVVHLAGVDFG